MKKFWINLKDIFSAVICEIIVVAIGIFMFLFVFIPCLFSKKWREDVDKFFCLE